ncbi:hypothetical protein RJT34_15145 [Clitoria ternatea]|uniref:Uncharacterized protein n=1 Tax=Clitoria ternatea TaxID=43366 RepID=A0AAN9PNK7_CLITE
MRCNVPIIHHNLEISFSKRYLIQNIILTGYMGDNLRFVTTKPKHMMGIDLPCSPNSYIENSIYYNINFETLALKLTRYSGFFKLPLEGLLSAGTD